MAEEKKLKIKINIISRDKWRPRIKTMIYRGDRGLTPIRTVWTCSDSRRHQHRWLWSAWLCGRLQAFRAWIFELWVRLRGGVACDGGNKVEWKPPEHPNCKCAVAPVPPALSSMSTDDLWEELLAVGTGQEALSRYTAARAELQARSDAYLAIIARAERWAGGPDRTVLDILMRSDYFGHSIREVAAVARAERLAHAPTAEDYHHDIRSRE